MSTRFTISRSAEVLRVANGMTYEEFSNRIGNKVTYVRRSKITSGHWTLEDLDVMGEVFQEPPWRIVQGIPLSYVREKSEEVGAYWSSADVRVLSQMFVIPAEEVMRIIVSDKTAEKENPEHVEGEHI